MYFWSKNVKGLIWLLAFSLFVLLAIISFHTLSFVSSIQKDLNDEFEKRINITAMLIAREIESDFDRIDSDPDFIASMEKRSGAMQIIVLDKDGIDIRDKNRQRVNLDKAIQEKTDKGEGAVISSFDAKNNRWIKIAYAPFKNPSTQERNIVIVKMFRQMEKGEEREDTSSVFIKILTGAVIIVLIFYAARAFLTAGRTKEAKEGDEAKIKGDTGFLIHTFHSLMQQVKTKEQELSRLRTEAEERTRVVEDYNEDILKSVSSGVIAFNKENKITTFNEAAEKILGIEGNGLLGKSCWDAFGEESGLCHLLNTTLQRQEGSLRRELEIVRGSSEKKWIGISSSILKDRKDEAIGTILIFSDITEIKGLQDEIRQKDRLTVLGELAGGIAHEFRNMMGTILGFAKLLSKKIGKKEPMQGMIEAIMNELNTMEMMINELLSLGKAAPLSLKPVDINKMLRNILIKSMAKEIGHIGHIGHIIDINIPLDMPEVMADELLIRQAFTNLIQNAIDAMPDGGRLEVSGRYYAIEGMDRTVEISIRDTGIGIAADKIERIFLPFFTTKPKGTGLGLALVHKIILSHNGKIEVESREGAGATFRVILPAASS
ncbi:MAG: ATP-binding protein [Nitrospirota bacterium]